MPVILFWGNDVPTAQQTETSNLKLDGVQIVLEWLCQTSEDENQAKNLRNALKTNEPTHLGKTVEKY